MRDRLAFLGEKRKGTEMTEILFGKRQRRDDSADDSQVTPSLHDALRGPAGGTSQAVMSTCNTQ
eukprot:10295970-Karenia_brevis.AAC.1